MMNLWELLKVSKGLPPPDLETLLLAKKISGKNSGSSMTTSTISGYPCVLENSAGFPAVGYKIYGNSIQNGTPSPDNPVEVQSVGESVFAKLYDSDGFRLADSDGYKLCSQDVAGYCIPVVTSGVNRESLITNIYLDEPLRKIGDYADVIDFERGVVERKIGKVVFDGSDDELWFYYSQAGVSQKYIRIDVIGAYTVLSDELKSISIFQRPYEYDSIYSGGSPPNIAINSEIPNSSVEWRNWLSENPITAYYVLAEPTTEKLALPKIPTFNGTTIISTDTEVEPSDIEITYKGTKPQNN